METTLHRQLKALYAADAGQQEIRVGSYRVDAVADGRLIEIQQGSLAAIRQKVRGLVGEYRLHVVKPIAARTLLVKRRRRGGPVESERYSPSRGTIYELFDDLVHFVGVFPNPNLTLEVLLTEQEEHRVAAAKRHWRSKGYRVEDRVLRGVVDRRVIATAADLEALLPAGICEPFTTAEIAEGLGIPRWLAQKMAYCLRGAGAVIPEGKRRNAVLYRRGRRAA